MVKRGLEVMPQNTRNLVNGLALSARVFLLLGMWIVVGLPLWLVGLKQVGCEPLLLDRAVGCWPLLLDQTGRSPYLLDWVEPATHLAWSLAVAASCGLVVQDSGHSRLGLNFKFGLRDFTLS